MTVPVRCTQRAVSLGASQAASAGSPSHLRDLRVAAVDWLSGPSGGCFRATDAGPRARYQEEGYGESHGTRAGIGRTNGRTPLLAKESDQAVPTGATRSRFGFVARGSNSGSCGPSTTTDSSAVGQWIAVTRRGDERRGRPLWEGSFMGGPKVRRVLNRNVWISRSHSSCAER